MAIAYIGLGSNMGNRALQIALAVNLLESQGVSVLKSSSVIETSPVGGVPQKNFFNAVIKVQTELSPNQLLTVCLDVERKLKRVRTVKNGPRTIDLDILAYDQCVIDTPQLTIPHPRLRERAFVTQPLSEIEPDWENKIPHAGHFVH